MKILVISLAGIGDTLLATPLIQELRLNHPKAVIEALVMWTGSRDILGGNPHLDRIHHFHMLKEGPWRTFRYLLQLRREGYDITLNTYPQSKAEYRLIARILGAAVRVSHRYDNRAWYDGWLVNREIPQTYDRHSVDQNLALLSLIGDRPQLTEHRTQLVLSAEERGWAERMLTDRGLQNQVLVGFHVGSGKTKNLALRRWPLEHYRGLIHRLFALRPDLSVLLFGGPEEQPDHEWLQKEIPSPRLLVPETRNMKQAAALLGACRAFLSIDSALMHLAAAMQVPHQFVIETATFNPTIEPYARPYVLIPNPAVKGRNLQFYRYDGEGIRGSTEELEALMRAVTVDQVFERMAPKLL
ncbi:MAG: glycosyltransferase family 9 protein [Verrucomicrobiales bacterium]|nr:glycosyltransferase family 9 protein [Verrucomicrobiales bacterium]